MPSKASIHVTKTTTRTRAKVRKGASGKGGNPNHCPVCGKFMGKKS